MTYYYNPFQPNNPVYRGMFVGRLKEIERTDKILYQTKHGNPTNIIYSGERGIGKSSLLLVAKYFAEGTLSWEDKNHNFLTIQFSITKDMSIERFVQKILSCLKRELKDENKIKNNLRGIWDFIKKMEVMGVKYNSRENEFSRQSMMDELIFAIVDTIKSITSSSISKDLGFQKERDGLVLLIDEADNAQKTLELGTFLKTLSEAIVVEGCNKLLIILAGLPNIHNILAESHESSLRMFEEFELSPLSRIEVKKVINRGIDVANDKHKKDFYRVDDDAIDLIYFFSEGYPHFVQQIGYCCIEETKDGHITRKVVENAFFNEGGALDRIGDRYYKDLFYNKINVESYRQILFIMAEKWNNWIKKSEIRKKFKGRETVLNNGLKALRDRNIILSKKGSRGQYRLQWQSFALWINRHRRIGERDSK